MRGRGAAFDATIHGVLYPIEAASANTKRSQSLRGSYTMQHDVAVKLQLTISAESSILRFFCISDIGITWLCHGG